MSVNISDLNPRYVDLCNPVGTNGKCSMDRHHDEDGLCRKYGDVSAGKRPKWPKWQERLLDARPHGNAGIRIREDFGFFVVDVDTPEEQATYDSWGLPLTYTVQTGRGLQYYLLRPEGRRVPGRLHGVLLRTNGQVVAPGSVHWTGALYVVAHDGPLAAPGAEWVDMAEREARTIRASGPRLEPGTYKAGLKAFNRFVAELHGQGVDEDEIVGRVEDSPHGEWLRSRGKDVQREVRAWVWKLDGRALPRIGTAGASLREERPKALACEYCGAAFEAKRSTARYCSPACRLKAHRSGVSVSPETLSVSRLGGGVCLAAGAPEDQSSRSGGVVHLPFTLKREEPSPLSSSSSSSCLSLPKEEPRRSRNHAREALSVSSAPSADCRSCGRRLFTPESKRLGSCVVCDKRPCRAAPPTVPPTGQRAHQHSTQEVS